MKNIKAFLPYVLIVVAVFVGRWTSPDNSKELERKYELERKTHLNQITNLKEALVDKDKAGKAIREKMYLDSVKTSNDLRANKEAYSRLKKKYNEINLNRASAHSLDSIVSSLYPNRN